MPLQRDIAGFMIRDTQTRAFVRFLNGRLKRRRQTIVFYANANFIVRCQHLRREISASRDIFVLSDGIALDAAAKMLFGSAFRENMNGTDFTPAILAGLAEERRVFLLGSDLNTVTAAAQRFGQLANVRIVDVLDGFSIWNDEEGAIRRIRQADPDILLVGMGNPVQEEWILRHLGTLDTTLIVGVGALFDFTAGSKPRAPESVRRLRLEWAYRLALEPRRLVGRYTLGIARFFAAVIAYRVKQAMR